MKKVFLTLAVTAVSVAAMSMVAFADPSLAVDKTTATVSGVEKGDYVSLLIVKSNKALAEVKDEDILYVDQATAGEDGTASFTFPEITGDSAKGAVVYSGYSSMTAEAAPLSKNYQAGGEDPEPPVTVIYGDVNGDGKVNELDEIVLARYNAEWDGYETINEKNADVNADGKVNELDEIVLARYNAEWDGYESLPVKK